MKSCSYVAREAKGRANFVIVAIASKLALQLFTMIPHVFVIVADSLREELS